MYPFRARHDGATCLDFRRVKIYTRKERRPRVKE
jgi:hypothetical protein